MSKLRFSGSERWINCPGSIKLIDDNELKESGRNDAADLGSAAHALGEKCLLENKNPSDFFGEKIACSDEEGAELFEIDRDMVDAVSVYVDYVNDQVDFGDYELLIEHECDLGGFNINGLETGTADAVLINRKFKQLEIVDYKNGAGILVNADENTQLMCYALAMLVALDPDRVDNWEITLTIVQPRCARAQSPISAWETSSNEIWAWAVNIMLPAARSVAIGEGELNPTEKGCRWCLAKGCCPKRYEITNELAMKEFAECEPNLELITADQKMEILKHSKTITAFLKDVGNQVFNELMSGSIEYRGRYKLVKENKRSVLSDEAFDPIASPLLDYLDEGDLYVQKPKGMGDLEKSIKEKLKDQGVKGFSKIVKEIMAQVKHKPEGGLCLAPQSDKRREESPSAVSDFENL